MVNNSIIFARLYFCTGYLLGSPYSSIISVRARCLLSDSAKNAKFGLLRRMVTDSLDLAGWTQLLRENHFENFPGALRLSFAFVQGPCYMPRRFLEIPINIPKNALQL